jgi:hypothetical protein
MSSECTASVVLHQKNQPAKYYRNAKSHPSFACAHRAGVKSLSFFFPAEGRLLRADWKEMTKPQVADGNSTGTYARRCAYAEALRRYRQRSGGFHWHRMESITGTGSERARAALLALACGRTENRPEQWRDAHF